MAIRCLFKCLRWLFILTAFIFVVHWWLCSKSYLFNEEIISSIALKHRAQVKASSSDPRAAYKQIYKDLDKQYPGHFLPEKDHQWVFMNAGGWMGSVCILHASLTEYVLFFGTAVDTVGHSGRYWANVTDTLLTGEFRQWPEGSLAVNVYKPGDTITHVWGEATAVNFKAGTWMVEYGRGFIPSTLSFALADTIFSTQDFVTLAYIIRVYAKALFLEACTSVGALL